ETANYWGAYSVFQSGRLSQFSEESLVGGDIVKPRSFRIIDNHLVLTGFLGMPWLYGEIATFFGSEDIIRFLTPALAVIGAFFFYLWLRRLFMAPVAWLATLLLLVLPAFWYYASKSMMPNVPFVSLLLIGLYLWQTALTTKRLSQYIWTGIFVGLALAIRSSEVIWVAPLFALYTIAAYRQVQWSYIWVIPAFILVGMLPMFFYNTILFSDPSNVGYQLGVDGQVNWLNYLLPFGFVPSVIALKAKLYLLQLFSWQQFYYIFALLSLIFILLRQRKEHIQTGIFNYTAIYLILSGLLILYYGSWNFSDNPNPRLVTIGTSYVRYWLPIYIGVLPIFAYGLYFMFRTSRVAYIMTALAVFMVSGVLGYGDVYADKQEGLIAVSDNIAQYKIMANIVMDNTEADSIIISRRHDKVFFPDRTVIFDLFYEIDYQRTKRLMDSYPVYMWDWQYSAEKLDDLNRRTYEPEGVTLQSTGHKYNNFMLYRMTNVTASN
ncbi:MAG: glycosyltransferase family 39 protein, partial [Candidatus Komeilibacteria bacterium]|nr:glycosyltransferase family 39 protein [Candidatus Komeilibacteria bacterium]